MKKSSIKIMPLLVATLVLINGVVNIIFAILPTSFYNKPDLIEASKVFSYVTYQQASSILTITVGVILICLGVGLYRKQRSSWLWSILILALLNIENIYPLVQIIPLCLGFTSLLILVVFHKHFNVRKRAVQTNIIIAWLSVIFAMLYGSIGCYLMRSQFNNIHSFIDSVYYTLVTYSTVGYGDITPVTADAKLFNITMILVGLGAFATVITVLLGPLLEKRLKRVFTMVEHLNHLRHHTIICGINQITIQMAKDLKKQRIEVLFIGNKDELIASVDKLGFEILNGDPCDSDTLKQSGLADCSYFICGAESDAQNLLITMVARDFLDKKQITSKIKIFTVLENPSNAEHALKSGANEVILPALLCSQNFLSMNDSK